MQGRRHRLGLFALPAAALLLALLGLALTARAQDKSLPLADYVKLIEQAEAALTNATPEQAPGVLVEQAQALAAVESVQLPSGARVRPEPLLGRVISQDTLPAHSVEQALVRLRAAQAQFAGAAGDDLPARLILLEEVFARPEFNTPVSLLERLGNWLRDLLRRWFPNWNPTGTRQMDSRVIDAILWVLAALGVIAILALLAGWIQRLARSLLTDAEAERPDLFGDLPRTAAEARQQAQDAAQSGAYRDAVRRLYLAALLQLSEARLLPFDPSLTNREALARLQLDSPVRPYLEPVVATFDQVWYGMHEPNQATFDSYAAAIDALDHAARRATQTGQTP